jgi:post-segregation antitoxin (ccd killing protein)
MQVYLPDDLYEAVKSRSLPASELLQDAVRAEIERRDLLEATDAYLAERERIAGSPSDRHRREAQALVDRILARDGRRAAG